MYIYIYTYKYSFNINITLYIYIYINIIYLYVYAMLQPCSVYAGSGQAARRHEAAYTAWNSRRQASGACRAQGSLEGLLAKGPGAHADVSHRGIGSNIIDVSHKGIASIFIYIYI